MIDLNETINVPYEEYRRVLIQNILQANIKEKKQIYYDNIHLLEDVDIIFVDERYKDMLRPIEKSGLQYDESRFYSPFEANNLFLLNRRTILNKESYVTNSYDISLDTQIVSYIYKNFKKISKDEKEKNIVDFLCSMPGVSNCANIGPYIDENCLFKNKFSKIVKENIYSFFYKRNRVTYSRLKSFVLSKIRTKEIVKKYYKDPTTEEKRYIYKQIYINLLKIFIIKQKKGKLKEKFLEYLDFQNEAGCATVIGLYNIALAVFEKKNLRLFNKIQLKKKDIIKEIDNVSWDIFHLYYLPKSMAYKINPKVDISLPIIFSNDKGLNEISKLMKLRSIGVDWKKHETYNHYDLREVNKIIGVENQIKYFSYDASIKRKEKRMNINLDEVILNLKDELLKIYE